MNSRLDRKKIAKQAYLQIEKECKRPLTYQEANFYKIESRESEGNKKAEKGKA